LFFLFVTSFLIPLLNSYPKGLIQLKKTLFKSIKCIKHSSQHLTISSLPIEPHMYRIGCPLPDWLSILSSISHFHIKKVKQSEMREESPLIAEVNEKEKPSGKFSFCFEMEKGNFNLNEKKTQTFLGYLMRRNHTHFLIFCFCLFP
jgi:hypothetical protein